MRIAVLWTGLSGYLDACLRGLATGPGVEVLVAHQAAGEDAPFEAGQFYPFLAGPQNQALRLAAALAAQDVETRVVLSDEPGNASHRLRAAGRQLRARGGGLCASST